MIDPTKKVNTAHNKLINNLFLKNYINSEMRLHLMNYNPITPRMYGLPKLHKQDVPLRPIVSTIGSSSYNLSKFLIAALRPLLTNNPYNVKNSFEFKNDIHTIRLLPSDVLCSFNVVALYTNIPIDLAIQEVNDRWEEIKDNTNLPQNIFINLLTFCLKENNFFKYDNLIYRQNKGLAMGNPLSPVLADLVMTKLMKSRLTLIKKYVDDIILVASPKQITDLFDEFQKFNNNMKFTKENEKDQQIAFLDLKLIRTNDKIITNWYSKPSNSNRLLNYLSSHPQRVKINI